MIQGFEGDTAVSHEDAQAVVKWDWEMVNQKPGR